MHNSTTVQVLQRTFCSRRNVISPGIRPFCGANLPAFTCELPLRTVKSSEHSPACSRLSHRSAQPWFHSDCPDNRTADCPFRRENSQIMHKNPIRPFLTQPGIVRPFVQELPFGGADVFCPLIFYMDQRPLPATEPEMLDPRKLEIFLLLIRHPESPESARAAPPA